MLERDGKGSYELKEGWNRGRGTGGKGELKDFGRDGKKGSGKEGGIGRRRHEKGLDRR